MATIAETNGTVNFDQTLTTDTRALWRTAVVEIADKARATLPQSAGRIDKAVALVLAGDVEVLGDGTARVASQSNGQTVYHIVNGHCDCRDYEKAPDQWCKHRLAHALYKRAYPVAKAKLEAATPASHEAPAGEAQVWRSNTTPTPTAPLPEAPASVNVHLDLAGRQVQLTLRDSDEGRVLARLDAILQRFPLTGKPADDTPHCAKHGVPLVLQHGKDGRTWYSHKTTDGWCKGK